MNTKTIALASTLAINLITVNNAFSADDLIVMEGDILVSASAEHDHNITRRGAAKAQNFIWPAGIIPYELHSNLSTSAREAVLNAIDHWNTHSAITLVELNDSTRADTYDYVTFTDGPGCASWVGRVGGAQEVWAGSNCTTGSMIHEIGHTIGLLHEHTRTDRDQYIEILWENVDPDKAFNFDINEGSTQNVDDYDYDSIMHYGEHFFSANGQPTIRVLDPHADHYIGQREATSIGDREAVAKLYATDLAIEATITENEVVLYPTNLGENDAHDLVLDIRGAGNLVNETTAAAWACAEALTFEGIRCNLAKIHAGEQADITLSFDRAVDHTFTATLAAKTRDTDFDNNTISSQAPLKKAAAMDHTASDISLNPATGGGGAGTSVLIILILFCGRIYKKAITQKTR